jgi:hypothetical protein
MPHRVCGESACAAVENDPSAVVVLYARAARSQPPPLPYFRVYYRGSGAPAHYFVPAHNVVASTDSRDRRWFQIDGAPLDAIRAAIHDLEPFAAPEAWPVGRDSAATPLRSLGTASLLIALTGAVLALRRYGTRSRRAV